MGRVNCGMERISGRGCFAGRFRGVERMLLLCGGDGFKGIDFTGEGAWEDEGGRFLG